MSLNSKAYFAYHERLLEPDQSVIHCGTMRRHKPLFIQKWEYLDSLTPDERAEFLKPEMSQDAKDQWNINNEKKLGL